MMYLLYGRHFNEPTNRLLPLSFENTHTDGCRPGSDRRPRRGRPRRVERFARSERGTAQSLGRVKAVVRASFALVIAPASLMLPGIDLGHYTYAFGCYRTIDAGRRAKGFPRTRSPLCPS
jgi:hypothetical protein